MYSKEPDPVPGQDKNNTSFIVHSEHRVWPHCFHSSGLNECAILEGGLKKNPAAEALLNARLLRHE
jgi:hypothetical protein